jgi:hypothetical protein
VFGWLSPGCQGPLLVLGTILNIKQTSVYCSSPVILLEFLRHASSPSYTLVNRVTLYQLRHIQQSTCAYATDTISAILIADRGKLLEVCTVYGLQLCANNYSAWRMTTVHCKLLCTRGLAFSYTPCRIKEEEEVYSSYSFLTSALDGVSCQRHASAALYSRERIPGTHCTGCWVVFIAGLDTEARGRNLFLCRVSNPDRPVCSDWATLVPIVKCCIYGTENYSKNIYVLGVYLYPIFTSFRGNHFLREKCTRFWWERDHSQDRGVWDQNGSDFLGMHVIGEYDVSDEVRGHTCDWWILMFVRLFVVHLTTLFQ